VTAATQKLNGTVPPTDAAWQDVTLLWESRLPAMTAALEDGLCVICKRYTARFGPLCFSIDCLQGWVVVPHGYRAYLTALVEREYGERVQRRERRRLIRQLLVGAIVLALTLAVWAVALWPVAALAMGGQGR
jgi:hypothetical protein